MASNAQTNKQSRKAYNHMVQPALPLIPGLKPQQARAVAVEPEPSVVDSEPAAQVLNSNGLTHVDTQSDVEESSPDTIRNDSPAIGEVAITTGDSQPDTPHQPDTAPEQSAIQTFSKDGDKQGDVEAKMGSESIASDVVEQEVADAKNKDAQDTAVTLQATEIDSGQEKGIYVNGHLPQASVSATEQGDQGRQQDLAATPEGLSSDRIEPSATPGHMNGVGSSQGPPTRNNSLVSQREQTNQAYEAPQAVYVGEAIRGPILNGNHQPSTTFAPPVNLPRSFNALPSLAEHLLLLNTTKEGVDIVIQVNPSNTQPFASYAHSIILFRSLRMRRLATRQQQSNNYGGNVITLYPARYVIPHAFEAAVRFLYSDTVLGKEFFVQPHSGADYQAVRVHNLDYLLSYWVSGIELGLEPVSICAERLLNSYLDWDILEITYKYALELANSPIISHGKSLTGSDYLVASSSIIKLILQFLANHIDIKNFKLETSSTHNLIPTRLPQLEDGRPKHNPALASMVFGSMPSSADMSPSSPQSEILPTASTFKDTVASNILLNVDFENLFAFNNFIQAPTIRDAATRKLMLDIVNEREIRRQKIHSSRVPNKERMANAAKWEPVGIKESILENNVLHRDRVGFLASNK